jgi:hypothetical protein
MYSVEVAESEAKLIVAPTPARAVEVTVNAVVTALAGANDDRRPKPNADTATSAMRLRSVFVDICFLSISRSEEFPPFGFG